MAVVASSDATSWQSIAFGNSTQREKNSRAAMSWRQTRATHIDLLVGNYLSHYFQELAEAIRTGASRFTRPRRHENMRFYSQCLPAMIPLRPWPSYLPRVKPVGRWDWFVFDNATAAFWDSMRPLAHKVLDTALHRCGLKATVRAPVLHFRCASAPLNRHSQYHFQRYSYLRAAARRYKRRNHGQPLTKLHILTCVADDVTHAQQAKTCTAYLDDLVAYLRDELQVEARVHNCAHSMFEDFAIMYGAPFLISTGSTMSLLPGLVRHVRRGTFISPLLFDEEALALNSRQPMRRVGCEACEWMAPRDHALCQCEVPDYHDVKSVLPLLRQPPPSGKGIAPAATAGPEAAALARSRRLRTAAIDQVRGCDAAGGTLMQESDCRAASRRSGFGRKWIGASTNNAEAAGCVLWEDGNVEFNRRTLPHGSSHACNVRGTCLCKSAGGGGGELQVVGEPAEGAA